MQAGLRALAGPAPYGGGEPGPHRLVRHPYFAPTSTAHRHLRDEGCQRRLKLQHAYGRAIDTPEHLRAPELGDAEAREAALEHLQVAVLHQGFPETATAPAVRAVSALLAEGRAHPVTVDSLVEFLGDAAPIVTSLAGNPHFAEELPDVADAVAAAYPVVLAMLETSVLNRALFYAEKLVAIARMAPLIDRREDLAAVVRDWLRRGPGARALWVRCLGRLGVDLRDLLSDPDPAGCSTSTGACLCRTPQLARRES